MCFNRAINLLIYPSINFISVEAQNIFRCIELERLMSVTSLSYRTNYQLKKNSVIIVIKMYVFKSERILNKLICIFNTVLKTN